MTVKNPQDPAVTATHEIARAEETALEKLEKGKKMLADDLKAYREEKEVEFEKLRTSLQADTIIQEKQIQDEYTKTLAKSKDEAEKECASLEKIASGKKKKIVTDLVHQFLRMKF